MSKRVRGKYERLFYERHARDLELAQRPGGHPRGLRWDPTVGERVIQFIEGYCRQHKGEWAGKPLTLEEWQRDIVRSAFGWLRADGTRRFRIIYIEVPRKNGKSELAGALGLYLLVADGEPGAEVYSSATKKDQARIVFKTAEAMVKASPVLRRSVQPFKNSLVVQRSSSTFEPLGADSNTLDGLNPHGNIVDELHAHRDRGVWDVLDTAMGARKQPLTIAITTAGTYDKESIGWQTHEYARQVLDGTFDDDSFFAFIAAADDGDDWFSEETHQKANPNWGISIKPSYLAKQAEKAQRQPSFLNEYLRLHLDVWTQQVSRWLPMDKWASGEPEGAPGADLRAAAAAREKLLAGRECFGGLDLSSKLDLTALALAFYGDKKELEVVCRFWLPQARIDELVRKGHRQYEVWVRDGWLTPTPGDVIDYDFIRAEVKRLSAAYQIRELSFDPWGATQLAVQLQDDGLTMVECRQGFKTLSEPCKDLVARVVEGKVRHMNNPVLRWCASNAVVTSDPAGNIKPDKEKASDRIDGIVALVMALSRGNVAVGSNDSVYAERGSFLTL